jgi:hypothetical protein
VLPNNKYFPTSYRKYLRGKLWKYGKPLRGKMEIWGIFNRKNVEIQKVR